MKQPPADFLRMLWYDSCVYDRALLETLVEVVGEDRVVLGSDYPVGDRDPLAMIESCNLVGRGQGEDRLAERCRTSRTRKLRNRSLSLWKNLSGRPPDRDAISS